MCPPHEDDLVIRLRLSREDLGAALLAYALEKAALGQYMESNVHKLKWTFQIAGDPDFKADADHPWIAATVFLANKGPRR